MSDAQTADCQTADCDPIPVLPNCMPWKLLAETSALALLKGARLLDLSRGDSADMRLGIVLTGCCAVERGLSDGRRVLCALFHEGDLFDLRHAESLRQGQMVALTNARVLTLDENSLESNAAKHGDIAQALMTQMRDHLSRMQDHATDLISKTPFERLASILFEFHRWPGATPRHGDRDSVRIPIRRSDIADYIGVKPETVSRAIRQLERENLIGIPENNQILLADRASLRRIADGGRPRQSTRRGEPRV